MIEVKNLVKCYGTHQAVDNLNFTIEKGKIYGFLGPNGAGKSTTMNIMTGYLGATGGEVLINGHNILSEPDKAKADIGYLPEQPPLYTDMTVMEYLEFVSALKRIDKSTIESQIEKIIHLVNLEETKDRLIRNLSKGFRQRVGLAQALIGFPEILILDEPTVGLDPQQIIEIRQLIRKLSGQHTIILSSHILSEVQEICDHIMIIYKGRLVASDTSEHLKTQLKGSGNIELVAKGSIQKSKEIIRELPSVVAADYTPDEEGCTKVLLTIDDKKDIREAVFWGFCGAQVPLLSMHNTNTTLEDIFLELTSEPEAETKVSVSDDIKKKEGHSDESNI